MTEERVQQLLRSLGEGVVPVEDEATAARMRARVVPKIEAALRGEQVARKARVRRRYAAGAFAVAAGFVGVAWFVARGPAAVEQARIDRATGDVTLTAPGGAPAVARPGVSMQPDAALDTGPAASARVVASDGATLDVGATSHLTLASSDATAEQFALAAGDLVVRVPKLGPRRSFVVRTPDAEVVVHGTAFHVEVCDACGGPSGKTRVSVTEGLVSVRHRDGETWLHAGERWPSLPTAEVPPSAPEPPIAIGTPAPPAETSAPREASHDGDARPTARKAEPSTLAEQNRLLAQALDARRRGNDARALALLSQLLERYPSSPLASEAAAERLRCLERLGRGSAPAPKP